MALHFERYELETGQQHTHEFTSQVTDATALLTSFQLIYDKPDHHVDDVWAEAVISSLSENKVTVKVNGYIKDDSGNKGGGRIGYQLIAEVE